VAVTLLASQLTRHPARFVHLRQEPSADCQLGLLHGGKLFYHANVVAIEQNLWQLCIALRRVTGQFVSLECDLVHKTPFIKKATYISVTSSRTMSTGRSAHVVLFQPSIRTDIVVKSDKFTGELCPVSIYTPRATGITYLFHCS
jgi:hypothetical protein